MLLPATACTPTTGAAPALTMEAVSKMKLPELKLTCSELKLDVRGSKKAKAPFQEALFAWIEQQGTGAEVLQPPQVELKVCNSPVMMRAGMWWGHKPNTRWVCDDVHVGRRQYLQLKNEP
jgi:hypothetical protein